MPASITKTDTFGFSASRPATTLPAVPPEWRISVGTNFTGVLRAFYLQRRWSQTLLSAQQIPYLPLFENSRILFIEKLFCFWFELLRVDAELNDETRRLKLRESTDVTNWETSRILYIPKLCKSPSGAKHAIQSGNHWHSRIPGDKAVSAPYSYPRAGSTTDLIRETVETSILIWSVWHSLD